MKHAEKADDLRESHVLTLDTKVYTVGETITATLTLQPGDTMPTDVWLTLQIRSEGSVSVAPAIANRIAAVTLRLPPAHYPAAAAAGSASFAAGATLTLQAVIPESIIGGAYKPTSIMYFMPDGSQRQVLNPDHDGNFVRRIADDPLVDFETPTIKDLK